MCPLAPVEAESGTRFGMALLLCDKEHLMAPGVSIF
jgi:hypothetical protein